MTNEGQAALFAAGGTMGEAAANRLFTHPKVAEQLDGLDRYLDEDEFRRLMEKAAARGSSGSAPARQLHRGDHHQTVDHHAPGDGGEHRRQTPIRDRAQP